jgi:hypothetical protein
MVTTLQVLLIDRISVTAKSSHHPCHTSLIAWQNQPVAENERLASDRPVSAGFIRRRSDYRPWMYKDKQARKAQRQTLQLRKWRGTVKDGLDDELRLQVCSSRVHH